MPCFILIRPTVWPQCMNVTDGQTGQERQRTDSIGRTVLQTVAQKQFALCYRSVVCLCCMCVTFVHCGQTVGRIKTKVGTQVGVSPGHIVLDGNPAPLPQKGTAPPISAHVYCGQTAGGIGLSPCGVRWGPSPLRAPSLIVGPFLLWPNGWMHLDATLYGARPQTRGLCVRWGHSPLPKKVVEPLPNFRPISIVAKRLNASGCHLVWR